LYLPAVGQCGEEALGLGILTHRERERKALEARPSLAAAIGSHHARVADADARVHHLLRGVGRDHGLLIALGAVLEAHEHRHLGAERLAVELERLLGAAVEKQVGLDLHWLSFSAVGGDWRDASVIDRLVGRGPEIETDIWRPGRGPGALRHQNPDQVLARVRSPGGPQAAVPAELADRSRHLLAPHDHGEAEAPAVALA